MPPTVEVPLPGDDPLIEAFLRAATRGERVWAWKDGQQVLVANAPPAAGGAPETTVLLVSALREAMGRSAAAAGERELPADKARDGGLAAAVIRQAIEAAESSRSLLIGASFGLRMRHSALVGGSGFRDCCREAGVDPDGLPAERRVAIDEAIAAEFAANPTASGAQLRSWLIALLQQRLH